MWSFYLFIYFTEWELCTVGMFPNMNTLIRMNRWCALNRHEWPLEWNNREKLEVFTFMLVYESEVNTMLMLISIQLIILSEVKLHLEFPPPRSWGFQGSAVCLSVQECTKTTRLIFMKFGGRVWHGPRMDPLKFGVDLTVQGGATN